MDRTLAIVGGRDFNDPLLMERSIDPNNWDTVVSGGARGADSLGAAWAKNHGKKLIEFLPDWSKYGKSAGFRRNRKIVDTATGLIAFWDGKSRGTEHSIDLARTKGIPVRVVYYGRYNV